MADNKTLVVKMRNLLLDNGISYLQEVLFARPRKFRFDFVILPEENKLAVEIEGGVYIGGRHTRPLGFIKDCEKYNLATELGWRLLRYTAADFKDPEKMIEQIKRTKTK